MKEVLDNLEELNKELKSMVSSSQGDTNTQPPPVDLNIDVWDTRKAWEQEFDLYPESSRDEVSTRLYVQVGRLLHKM